MLRKAKTENGIVKGLAAANTRITVYKGIPFAAPPTGENRWRAPQPAKDWEGELEAYSYKNISVQDQPGIGEGLYNREWHVDSEVPMGEDCLYLNIWTPAVTTEDNLPVIVWFFGGGFQWGYPCEMEFDGENMAKRGVILVTVNYRLGALGFLAHPELTKTQKGDPANFGNLDQKAGLHWVYRNIKNFGGNPENITIGGQSAGGASALLQLTCPGNHHIVKGAIIMSGLIRNPYQKDKFITPQDISYMEKVGEDFFEFMGVKTLAEARKLDPYFIREKYAEFAKDHPRFSPCIDHVFCVDEPYKLLLEGKCPPVPVISGNTEDEFPTPKELLPDDGHEPVNGIECTVKAAGKSFAKKELKQKMYYYRFKPDIPGWDNPGTFHSVDLWFFFDNIDKCWRPFMGRHHDLARQMCNYWVNLAKTGDPNGNDVDGTKMPEWKPYGQVRNEMEFTSNGPVACVNDDEYTENLIDKVISNTYF